MRRKTCKTLEAKAQQFKSFGLQGEKAGIGGLRRKISTLEEVSNVETLQNRVDGRRRVRNCRETAALVST